MSAVPTMNAPAAPPRLVAVAHGSRDQRSAATIRALTDVAAELDPVTDVVPSFLDLSTPNVRDVLVESHTHHERAIVVAPLLLGNAYHARSDLPAVLTAVTTAHPGMRVSTADILGVDPLLESVALDRVRETGADPSDERLGIVITAVGSSHHPANETVRRLAARWQRSLGGARVCAAFATAAGPDVPTAISQLRARGARRIVLASWFLAPGLLPDRVARLAVETDPGVRVADPLGADRRVARVLLERCAAARPPHARDGGACARLSA